MTKKYWIAGLALAGVSSIAGAQELPPVPDTPSAALDALLGAGSGIGMELMEGLTAGQAGFMTFADTQQGILEGGATALQGLQPDPSAGLGENGLTVGIRRGGEALGTGLQDQSNGDGGIRAGGAALEAGLAAGSDAAQAGITDGSEALFGSDSAAPTGLSGGLQALQTGLATQDPQAAAAVGMAAVQNSLTQGQAALEGGAAATQAAVMASAEETVRILEKGASNTQMVLEEAMAAGIGGAGGDNPAVAAANIIVEASDDTAENIATNLAGAGGANLADTAGDVTEELGEGVSATADGLADDIARGGPEGGGGLGDLPTDPAALQAQVEALVAMLQDGLPDSELSENPLEGLTPVPMP